MYSLPAYKYLVLSISDIVIRIAVIMIVPKIEHSETYLFRSKCKNYISSQISYHFVDEFNRISTFIHKYAYILRLIIKKVYTWIRCCHLIICHLLQFEIISDIFKHLKLLILPPSHNIFSWLRIIFLYQKERELLYFGKHKKLHVLINLSFT